MAGVLTDLHAADVRYHVDCKASFMCTRSIQAASHQSSITASTDKLVDRAFNTIIEYVAANKTMVHNSIDLYNKYVQEGGNILSRRQLITNTKETFENDLIALSSPGIALH